MSKRKAGAKLAVFARARSVMVSKLKSASVRLLIIFFVDTMHHGALGYNQHRGKVHHNPRNKGAEDSNKNPQQTKQYWVDIEVFPNPSYDTGDYVVFA